MEKYIDKDINNKHILNLLNEEVIGLSKKISEIKNEISKLSNKKIKNGMIIKNYKQLYTEYKNLIKITLALVLAIGIIVPSVGFGTMFGLVKTLKVIAITVGLGEVAGLITNKLLYEHNKNKYKVKYFNNKNITIDEMTEKVEEENNKLTSKIEVLEKEKKSLVEIKCNKKEEIERINEKNKEEVLEEEKRKEIKFEDSEKKLNKNIKSVKKKK